MALIPTFTREEQERIARSLEDGTYFKEARSFYGMIYMSIMPERCHYILLVVFAAIASLLALLALGQLLPLKPTKPLLLPMENVLRDIPVMTQLRESADQPVDDALQRYFLREYVRKREAYSFDSIQANVRFVYHYSVPDVQKAYRRYINPRSSRSPVNRFGRHTERKVEIRDIEIKRSDGEELTYAETANYTAAVDLYSRVVKNQTQQSSRWRAYVEFQYQPLTVMQPENPETEELNIEPMEFKVTDYTVKELIPETE